MTIRCQIDPKKFLRGLVPMSYGDPNEVDLTAAVYGRNGARAAAKKGAAKANANRAFNPKSKRRYEVDVD